MIKKGRHLVCTCIFLGPKVKVMVTFPPLCTFYSEVCISGICHVAEDFDLEIEIMSKIQCSYWYDIYMYNILHVNCVYGISLIYSDILM